MGRGFIDKDPLVRGNGATGWSEKVVGPFSIAVFWFMVAFRASPWKVTRLVRSPAGADNHMTHNFFFYSYGVQEYSVKAMLLRKQGLFRII